MSTTSITCPNCGKTKLLPTEKVPAKQTTVSCRTCHEKFEFISSCKATEAQTNHENISAIVEKEEQTKSQKSILLNICLIIFSVPFLKRAISTGIIALQPNIYGATSKAIFFGVIGLIPLYFGVRGLIKNRRFSNEKNR